MLERPVAEELQPLKVRVEKMVELYEQALKYVKEAENQEMQDFLARRLYDITAEIIMSLLILEDATRAPELFAKSANVYVRYAEANIIGHHAYIINYIQEDLPRCYNHVTIWYILEQSSSIFEEFRLIINLFIYLCIRFDYI